jgi:hypothetical protein
MNSFTKISNTTAKLLAEGTLAKIKQRRETAIEKEIDKMIQWDYRTFLAKLSRTPKIQLTRKQALQKLKASAGTLSEYDFITIRYGFTEEVAKRILALVSQSTSGYIYITGEDLIALF